MIKPNIYRMSVEFLDSYGEYSKAGQVLLPANASSAQVEHALAAVGVYAPRGYDRLEWADDNTAWILDANDDMIVRLLALT